MDETVRAMARSLPRVPGVYLWKGARGEILYVGKAQDLRARVTSYLGTPSDEKHAQLMADANALDFVAVSTVKEALLLEQTLIKRHRPLYNVMLVDDKKYPYIGLANEEWPRVVYTRNLSETRASFGPFPDAGKAKRIARMLGKMFRLRQCRVLPVRECLYYHMGQCSAPCIGAVTKEQYETQTRQAVEFLEGRGAELSKKLRADMAAAAEAQRFEQAGEYRDLADAIDSVLERQSVDAIDGGSYDAIGVAARDDRACALIVFVRDGAVVGREAHMLNRVRHEAIANVVGAFLEQYYTQAVRIPAELLLPVPVPEAEALEAALTERRGAKLKLRVPERGESRRHVELAEENARLSLEQEFLARERRGSAALEELQTLLGLPDPPEQIDAFDISHHAGELTVASLVCLRDGKPFKSGYRRFRIRSTSGGDDPGAMREVVERRYMRLLEEGGADELPDLILIDGGRTQLGAAHEELKKLGLGEIPIIGLAKRFEEVYRPALLHPLKIDPHSSALHVLQLARDEAHRFAIGYQGVLKRRAFLHSTLDEIPGVGPERRRRILATFGSVDAVRRTSETDLARVPGVPRPLARRILQYLRQESATASAGADEASDEDA